MEDFKYKTHAMVKKAKRLFAYKTQRNSNMLFESQKNFFDPDRCPKEIRSGILEYTAINNYYNYGNIGGLRVVCKDWQSLVDQDKIKQYVESVVYQRFLRGKLIYRPKEESDEGRIDLPIIELDNPLEGTFDLSKCGSSGKYLTISTGYPRKERRAGDAGKVEIWFVPRFSMKKEMTTKATPFDSIFNSWKENVEVGVIWTWGGDLNLLDYDYLITENMDNLAKDSLNDKWFFNAKSSYWRWSSLESEKFHILFSSSDSDEYLVWGCPDN
jgi:hypothetical protein